jgi:hypothetical protein
MFEPLAFHGWKRKIDRIAERLSQYGSFLRIISRKIFGGNSPRRFTAQRRPLGLFFFGAGIWP